MKTGCPQRMAWRLQGMMTAFSAHKKTVLIHPEGWDKDRFFVGLNTLCLAFYAVRYDLYWKLNS